MKTLTYATMCLTLLFAACNNDGDRQADSDTATSRPTSDTSGNIVVQPAARVVQTDSASKHFMIKAADGGLTEVVLATMASTKVPDSSIRRFAMMLLQEHTTANNQLKTLASERQVDLPPAPSFANQQVMVEFEKKNGADFQQAYVTRMVADHRQTISLYETAAKQTSDSSVKSFIAGTLPVLRAHLDSAMRLQKKVR